MSTIKQLLLTDKLNYLSGYYMKVMPEVKKTLNNVAAAMPDSLGDPRTKKVKPDTICGMDNLRSACTLVSQGTREIVSSVEFIVSLHALCQALDNILETRELSDLSQILQLYQPLTDSINLDNPADVSCEYYRSKEITAYLKILRDTCREKISRLPSYSMVAGKMKKYAKLYIEYQSCKYQPLKIRYEHMRMWSAYYIKQFPDILFWEFSASSDSLLGICAMYLCACDPLLTEVDTNKLDSAYMPWVCAYQKMLHYYVNAREDIMTSRINLSDYYKDLKYCEERIRFLARKALDSCSRLSDSNIHAALVQALPVIYLSNPRAGFGLNRLASRNIMNDSSPLARTLWNCSKLHNAFK